MAYGFYDEKILSKYPVAYQGMEFRVDIIKCHAGEIHSYDARVYIKNSHTWFGFTFSTWEKVNDICTGWNCNWKQKDYWEGAFVELAKQGVVNYVKKNNRKIKTAKDYENGINEFNGWDGKIVD